MSCKRLGDLVRNTLPSGTYSIRIDKVEAGTSDAGKPKITFSAVVTRGTDRGKTLIWSRSLQENSVWSLATDLLRAGIASEDDTPEGDAGFLSLANRMRGGVYTVKVKEVTGEKGTFNDVRIEGAYGGDEGTPAAAPASITTGRSNRSDF